MRNGFICTIFVGMVVLVFAYLDVAHATGPCPGGNCGAHQSGSWDGVSESFSGVIIDQGGDSHGAEAPDMGDMVPNVTPPSFATAYDCAGAFSGGVAIAGFGGSAGGTKESEECNRRADAAYAAKLSNHIHAREIMCASERYYMGNKRAAAVYASVRRPFADDQGMPLACLANSDFDKTHEDREGNKRRGQNDAHGGAIPSSWSED